MPELIHVGPPKKRLKEPEPTLLQKRQRYAQKMREKLIGEHRHWNSNSLDYREYYNPGTITRRFQNEWSTRRKPETGHTKYIAKGKRRKAYMAQKALIEKAVRELLLKEDWNIPTASDVGFAVLPQIREIFSSGTWEDNVAHNKQLDAELRGRFSKAISAVDQVEAELLCGNLEDGPGAYAKLQDIKW